LFDDLEGDPRNPWLASVFVPAEQRGKGIASAMVAAVEAAARRLGYPMLYLFTTSAARLYAGLGWRALERRPGTKIRRQILSLVRCWCRAKSLRRRRIRPGTPYDAALGVNYRHGELDCSQVLEINAVREAIAMNAANRLLTG
jgi:predicted GNAT family acetyltransferase